MDANLGITDKPREPAADVVFQEGRDLGHARQKGREEDRLVVKIDEDIEA